MLSRNLRTMSKERLTRSKGKTLRFLPLVMVLLLLIYLTSFNLPRFHQLNHRESETENREKKHHGHMLTNASESVNSVDKSHRAECDGSNFQIKRVQAAFQACVTKDEDILLKSYLEGWIELQKRRECKMHATGRGPGGGHIKWWSSQTRRRRCWRSATRSSACPSQTSGPSTTAVTGEGDSSEELPASEGAPPHLSEPSTSADAHTSVDPSGQLVGLAPGESPHTSEREQTLVAGAAVESPCRWVHSSPDSAQLDTDAEPWGPSFKRRMIEGQQHIWEVLEQVPRTPCTITERLEESNSCLSGIVAQVSAEMSAMEGRLASIKLQARLTNESNQALTTAVRTQGEQHSTTLNRQSETLQLGLQGIMHILQTVVQLGGRSDVGLAQERDDGKRGHGSGDATQNAPTSHPLPPLNQYPQCCPLSMWLSLPLLMRIIQILTPWPHEQPGEPLLCQRVPPPPSPPPPPPPPALPQC
ncbi:uncharacterized protein [Heptranchias perlo]|uniref:uncharacterized protein isoform X2 n=1 Tax=Heptranchias perlo TaxID=212740 RepID=UPI00355AAE6C